MTIDEIKKELQSINNWIDINNNLSFTTRNDCIHDMLTMLMIKIKKDTDL